MIPQPHSEIHAMKALDAPQYLYSAADTRLIDQTAIHDLGLAGIELMERAGSGALAALREYWPHARTLSVVCGAGNNGGDAYVVARRALEFGLDVRAYPATPPESLKGDARLAYERYRDQGGEILEFIPEDFEATEILVDGLLGTGLDRDVTGHYAEIIEAINRYRERGEQHAANQRAVAALDIPSGLHADTGSRLGVAVKADLTVSFVALKRGLFTGDGPELAGEVVLDDLSIPCAARQKVLPSARLWTPPFPPLPRRPLSGHKGLYGHVLVVGGDNGFSGAVRLAAEAAARVGAGLVSVATRADQAMILNLTRPELMVHGVENPASLDALLDRATVVAIGPGLGQSSWGLALLERVLTTELPLIVDADALNLLGETPCVRHNWVLTPHPGEAGRLLGMTSQDIQRDRFTAIGALQSRYGGTIVLKGSGTLILTADGIADICGAGNPGMASGGMGDVLTGVIAGLIAQNIHPAEAARFGVCLHAAAGDLAARDGERGLLASDLLGKLRGLINGPAADDR